MYDVIVIGGGPAGVTAALRACELGATVGLVERDHLGGTCTNDGCVPTRVLAKAARLARDAEQFSAYGLVGDRPEVKIADLIARAQQTVYRVHEKKQLLAHLKQAGTTVWDGAGSATFVDPHRIRLSNGQNLEAENYILCTGGHARRLNFPGSEHALTHNDVWRFEKLPTSIAIIGGAATGCQLASIFAAFGVKVRILDVAPTILGAEDAQVCQTMAQAFQRKGIEIITGIQGINRIESGGLELKLYYDQDGKTERIEVENVIMSVGWIGNISDLNLAAAGVESSGSYVIVDDCLRTTAGHIYAAGDLTGRMMLVQSATHEGRVAAENAILGADSSDQHLLVPHGGFTDPEYGSVGLTEEQAKDTGSYLSATVPYGDLDRAVIDGRTEGFCKLIISPETRQILGAHVVGEQALEVVQIAAAGMAAGIQIEQMAELELAYPTYTAIIGLTARQLVRKLDLRSLTPVWRALKRVESQPAEWEIRSS
jgi:pyruvate/2-oxoglutarate dehydrogenase complex dihydrolipoamide dehydrogenase (E3) component